MLIGRDSVSDNSGSYGALDKAPINLYQQADSLDDFTFIDATTDAEGEEAEHEEEEEDKRTLGEKFKATLKAMTVMDWVRVLLVLLLVSAVLVIGGLALLPNSPVLVILQEILDWIQNLPRWLAGVLMIELFALVIPIGCPITPLNLVSGFLFDVWFGFAVAITGASPFPTTRSFSHTLSLALSL